MSTADWMDLNRTLMRFCGAYCPPGARRIECNSSRPRRNGQPVERLAGVGLHTPRESAGSSAMIPRARDED